jgi:hypothetical protein
MLPDSAGMSVAPAMVSETPLAVPYQADDPVFAKVLPPVLMTRPAEVCAHELNRSTIGSNAFRIANLSVFADTLDKA